MATTWDPAPAGAWDASGDDHPKTGGLKIAICFALMVAWSMVIAVQAVVIAGVLSEIQPRNEVGDLRNPEHFVPVFLTVTAIEGFVVLAGMLLVWRRQPDGDRTPPGGAISQR